MFLCAFISINALLSYYSISRLCLKKNQKKVHRGEAALCKHLREHEQKAALSSERKKVEISLE